MMNNLNGLDGAVTLFGVCYPMIQLSFLLKKIQSCALRLGNLNCQARNVLA